MIQIGSPSLGQITGVEMDESSNSGSNTSSEITSVDGVYGSGRSCEISLVIQHKKRKTGIEAATSRG